MWHIALNSGVKMPIEGFGASQVRAPRECEHSVLDAVSVGYRLIYTAAPYGNGEAVGEAVKKSGCHGRKMPPTFRQFIQNEIRLYRQHRYALTSV